MDEGLRRRIAPRAAVAVAVLSFGGYFGVARVVGNVYPFSTFPMYAGEHVSTGSRIVAKDDFQHLREVSDGEGWECDFTSTRAAGQSISKVPGLGPLDPSVCADGDVYTIPYVDREAFDFVRAHQASDPRARPVELVRHIWRFPHDEGPPIESDCHIAHCQAVFP